MRGLRSRAGGWRGARTGEGRTDEHRLDNMRLVVGAAVESRACAGGGLHRQQFYRVAYRLCTTRIRWCRASSRGRAGEWCHQGGAVSNLMLVRITSAGSKLDGSASWRQLAARFAVRRRRKQRLRLRWGDAERAAVHYERLSFTHHAEPTVSSVSPDSGPSSGGTSAAAWRGLTLGRNTVAASARVARNACSCGRRCTLLCVSPLLQEATRLERVWCRSRCR